MKLHFFSYITGIEVDVTSLDTLSNNYIPDTLHNGDEATLLENQGGKEYHK